MSSLSELPEVVGFFSYSREDDEDLKGELSSLHEVIQRELRAALGRSRHDFRLWRDQEALAPGTPWESAIASTISSATFFISVMTPRAAASKHCTLELEAFVARERALGRDNLVFPIHYITVPALTEESRWRSDPMLSVIGARQLVDWRGHRQLSIDASAYRQAIIDFCASIATRLREPLLSPEQRQAVAESATRAEEEKVRREAATADLLSAWVRLRRRNLKELQIIGLVVALALLFAWSFFLLHPPFDSLNLFTLLSTTAGCIFLAYLEYKDRR